MKTTYLMNKVQPDGSIRLSIATFEEWLAMVEANKSLPASNAIKLTRNYQTRKRANFQQGQTREGEVIVGAEVLEKCA